jgi:SMI1-KNR4 cell-wall
VAQKILEGPGFGGTTKTRTAAMKQSTLDTLDAKLAEFPIMRAEHTPSEDEIAQAEQAVGFPFASDYREFLLRYGGCMAGAFPIFGLRPVEVMGTNHWSVTEVTRKYRAKGASGADRWAVISEDHAGNPIGMDRAGAIWISDHDFGGISPLASTFEAYLGKCCLELATDE